MELNVGSYVHGSEIIEIVKDHHLDTYYRFKCSCGKIFTRRRDTLRYSIVKGIPISCGCKKRSRDDTLTLVPENAPKLNEVIQKLSDDIVMHIGVSEGGWMFIGNKAKFKKFFNETKEYLNRKIIEQYDLSDIGHIGIIISGTAKPSRRYWFEHEYDRTHGLEVK